MEKKKSVFLFILVFTLILFGCASMNVAVKYDKDADFQKYKTFFLNPPKHQSDRPGAVHNPLFKKEVMEKIKPILIRKGFLEAAGPDEADLQVVFYAMVKNRLDFVPPAYRVGRWGRVWAVRPGHTVRYQEGTLVIDIVDGKNKDLVWQGIGKGVLDRNDPSQNLIDAVKKVLEPFPPIK